MKYILIGLITCSTTVVRAQDFMGFLIPSTSPTQLEIKGSALSDKETSMHSSTFFASHKVYNERKKLVTVSGKWERLGLGPKSEYIRDFHSVNGTIGYREELSEERFQFFSLGYGTASDQPFKNGRDGVLNLNYLRKFSNNWYGLVNYSNNRTFLNNIPIPGFIYVHELTRDRFLLYGFPFLVWGQPLSENFAFSLAYRIPLNLNIIIKYTKLRWIVPYLAFEQGPESFFRHDREEKSDRFFWFERKLGLGAEVFMSMASRLDFSAGYAFDREFSEAKDFQKQNKFKSTVENNFYVAASIKMSL